MGWGLAEQAKVHGGTPVRGGGTTHAQPAPERLVRCRAASDPRPHLHRLAAVKVATGGVGGRDDRRTRGQRRDEARLGHADLLLLHRLQQRLQGAIVSQGRRAECGRGWAAVSARVQLCGQTRQPRKRRGQVPLLTKSRSRRYFTTPLPALLPTWCSPAILSNSSTQHTPRSPSTTAPASNIESPVTGSRTTLTVRPAPGCRDGRRGRAGCGLATGLRVRAAPRCLGGSSLVWRTQASVPPSLTAPTGTCRGVAADV